MDYLWNPWRFRYVAEPKSEDCIFCAIAQSSEDERNLVIHRARYNFLLLNRFPYSTGHLMIVPYEHVPSLNAAASETAAELMTLMRAAEALLAKVYHPEGLNMGLNLGASAGAGVAAHLHMHAVPRWPGDANFMTTIGETRLLPEDLTTSFAKLRAECAQW